MEYFDPENTFFYTIQKNNFQGDLNDKLAKTKSPPTGCRNGRDVRVWNSASVALYRLFILKPLGYFDPENASFV